MWPFNIICGKTKIYTFSSKSPSLQVQLRWLQGSWNQFNVNYLYESFHNELHPLTFTESLDISGLGQGSKREQVVVLVSKHQCSSLSFLYRSYKKNTWQGNRIGKQTVSYTQNNSKVRRHIHHHYLLVGPRMCKNSFIYICMSPL